MKQHIEFVKKRSVQNLHLIILFSILFVVLGRLIPDVFFKYFDKTEYYKIYSPITVAHKTYKACDIVDVYIHRKSLIDTNAKSVIELTLIKENGKYLDEVYRETRDIAINKGEETIVAHWQIPCFVSAGNYFFIGNVSYKINEINKNTTFKTEVFEVKK